MVIRMQKFACVFSEVRAGEVLNLCLQASSFSISECTHPDLLTQFENTPRANWQKKKKEKNIGPVLRPAQA